MSAHRRDEEEEERPRAEKPPYNDDERKEEAYIPKQSSTASVMSIRKRGRSQKIFNPGPLGADDDDDDYDDRYDDDDGQSHVVRASNSRGKSIDIMRRRQRPPARSPARQKRDYDEEDGYDDYPRERRKRDDYEEERLRANPKPRVRVNKRKIAPEIIDVDADPTDDDAYVGAKRETVYDDEEPYQRPQNRHWKRESPYECDDYEDPEASRVFPGYSSGARVSSFTNKPVTGSFPAVASKGIRRPVTAAYSDEEFDDYDYEAPKRAARRYEDYDELGYRRTYEDESRGLPPRHRRRRRPLEQDYADYHHHQPSSYRRRSDSLEEDEYGYGAPRRRRLRERMYAPEERIVERRVREPEQPSRRRGDTVVVVAADGGKARVPETVSIISNDSRGSGKASPVEKPLPKRHKKLPAQPPRNNFRAAEPVEPKRRYVDETVSAAAANDDEKHWDSKRHRATLKHPTFDFCVGTPDSHVDYHIMVMTAQDHERNPMVTKLMMEDHVYTAYPFKRRELLNYAQSGDLEPIAKAVAQMFQKYRKEIHVRVEFIGHRQFVEGRAISLVVGTVESDPVAPKRLVKETSVVTVVGGTFKGGRGVVRAIRDDMVLLVMHENGNNVLRWMHLNFVELMDESRLLNQLVPPKPQSNHRPANQRDVDSLLMDSEMMTALQNDLFIDRPLTTEASRNDGRNDDFMSKDQTPRSRRKSNNETRDFLEDIEDHLSASFDPDLYNIMGVGTPRPYDDGTAFLSPLLRDAEYGDEVDKFDSRPSSADALNRPDPDQETKKPAAKPSPGPPVPELNKNDGEKPAAQVPVPAAAAAVVAHPVVQPLINVKLDTAKVVETTEASRRPKVAKTKPKSQLKEAPKKQDEGNYQSKPPAVEKTTMKDARPAGGLKKAPVPVSVPVAVPVVAEIVQPEELHRPPKKRKSVPAIDLLDRRNSRANIEPEDNVLLPPLPPPIEDDDIPPSTEEKVFVNSTTDDSVVSPPADPTETEPDVVAIAIPVIENETKEVKGIKRGRGRPRKKFRDRDTSSAWNFLQSMSVLELKDKLRRMKLPSTGNRTKLFYKITSALMVDQDTPIEVLPDMITRFTPA